VEGENLMERSLNGIGCAVAALLLLVATSARPASAEMTTQTGMLTCQVAKGFGWIIGSSRTVQCDYRPTVGLTEHYSGTISKVGLDIGYLAPIFLAWAVVAPSTVPSGGALAGRYFGGTVEAAAGIGAGVNVLIGGFDKSVTLQPVSIEGETGLYIGVGIAALNLQLDDRPPTPEIGRIPDTE
jgi:hypothetical protein